MVEAYVMRGDKGGTWLGNREESIRGIIFSSVAADKRPNQLENGWIATRGVWLKIT